MKRVITAPRTIELELESMGYRRVCGVDEVGRGALAGPVVAAAVVLPQGTIIDGVRDSKIVAEAEREHLAEVIRGCAISVGVGVVESDVIDSINILQATFVAMRRAVEMLDPHPDMLIVDGRDAVTARSIPSRAIIGGDRLSHSVAAASIVAKVVRDAIMRSLHNDYPHYGFAQHKGYATAAHFQAIRRYGELPIHRTTFLRRERERRAAEHTQLEILNADKRP